MNKKYSLHLTAVPLLLGTMLLATVACGMSAQGSSKSKASTPTADSNLSVDAINLAWDGTYTIEKVGKSDAEADLVKQAAGEINKPIDCQLVFFLQQDGAGSVSIDGTTFFKAAYKNKQITIQGGSDKIDYTMEGAITKNGQTYTLEGPFKYTEKSTGAELYSGTLKVSKAVK